MLLAIDAGNTCLKLGLFEDDNLKNKFNLKYSDDLKKALNNLSFSSIAISSVVPDKIEHLLKELSNITNIKPFLINKNSDFNLNVSYQSPETLGIDRICSCEGAYSMKGKLLTDGTYLLTIDFGTATTINLVKPPGVFIGGAISPGINTMFQSLYKSTSQLPEIDIKNYKSVIGNDTNTSIASGVINSTVGLIDRFINFIKCLDDCKQVEIFITGGMSNKVTKFLSVDFIFEEFLVLKGINSIYNLNIN